MASDTLRWSKFWWSDWQADHALRSCGLAARGLWMEMLCIANSGTPRGYVTINGVPVSTKRLAVLSGITERECASLLQELREAGVFSETPEGVIYSRRMVRDTAVADAGREAVGKRWQKRREPTHEGTTPPNRDGSTLEARSQKLEAEGRVPPSANAEGSSPPSAETPPLPLLPDGEPPPPPRDAVPVQWAVEEWNRLMPPVLAAVQTLTDKRRTHLRARLVEHFRPDYRAGWTAYLQRILRSSFLTGRAPGKAWKADIDFAIRADACARILEGRYDDTAPNSRRGDGYEPVSPGTV